MKKVIAVILALTMATGMLALTACGGSKPENTTTEISVETESLEPTSGGLPIETEGESADNTVNGTVEQVDLSNPSIIIEYGDVEAINDLAKKAQNFELEEGTVVTINGIFSEGILTPSIVEDDGNGNKLGLTLYIDGDADLPADGTDIEVTGAFTKGSFFMEFHVAPENIVVE